MKILLVEDDKEAAEYLIKGLKEQGFVVDHAAEGKQGLFLAMSEPYDALILDRMLPEVDGMNILKTIRGADNDTPVLMLTAMGSVDDKVEGLSEGADDYLVKPFSFTELLARLEAITRRKGSSGAPTTLTCGELEMNLLARTVTRAGKSITLKTREFQLLEYLMRHAEQVVTRTMLLEKVWDYNFDPQTNVIDVHISRLRAQVDKDFDFSMIQTLRGSGYKLTS